MADAVAERGGVLKRGSRAPPYSSCALPLSHIESFKRPKRPLARDVTTAPAAIPEKQVLKTRWVRNLSANRSESRWARSKP